MLHILLSMLSQELDATRKSFNTCLINLLQLCNAIFGCIVQYRFISHNQEVMRLAEVKAHIRLITPVISRKSVVALSTAAVTYVHA